MLRYSLPSRNEIKRSSCDAKVIATLANMRGIGLGHAKTNNIFTSSRNSL
jgi:hypothetical protein